ncbi:PF07603 domain protein [Leptospira interrogans serovar Grippotyphosa str. LT2186]|uniref:PF07603 domain protein n=1 Tax=Leptospira interrogans serovar Grippotyphosa str. LT2186 TaxID=1001599 RepID=M3I872_LEPIR|nr:PF07603 domain protein [Leptospira interrogans serovar Grippotyphosa str. LT2186]
MFGGIGSLDWSQARGNCNGKVLVPGRVWRLPNINELLSIIDYSDPNPILPTIRYYFFSKHTQSFRILDLYYI